MKSTIITIGDEILIGQIVDTNSAWLGQQLSLLGVSVVKIITIADKEQDIKSALDEYLKVSDLLILTGGLGPTKDDITKKTISEYLNSGMELHAKTYEKIKSYYDSKGIPFLKAHEDQCYMPLKADLLDNNLGTAPGMLFKLKDKLILSLPGVPYEMKWIFTNSFLPKLREIKSIKHTIYHKTIKTVGRGESIIAEQIGDIVTQLPPHISLAYLPSIGTVRLRLSSIADHDTSKEVDEYADLIKNKLGTIVYGAEDDDLAATVLQLYREKNLSIGTAESCTGGLVAHKLTSIPGSSDVYHGSIVSYSYKLKEDLLKVSNTTLINQGAVSQETVKEMLKGLIKTTSVDIGIAISGIAGPGGGTPEKPVGTIWMAWGTLQSIKTKQLNLTKNRKLNVDYTSIAALNALRLYAINHC